MGRREAARGAASGKSLARQSWLHTTVSLDDYWSSLRESIGGGLTVESGRWETEHPRDAARRLLTDTQIERAWARGRTMSLEGAVAYARS
jgi:hypothetical protein